MESNIRHIPVPSFSEALLCLKTGQRITRLSWENAFASMTPATHQLPADRFWSPHNRRAAENQPTGALDVAPSITVCRNGVVTMGWVPSNDDLFANDWCYYQD